MDYRGEIMIILYNAGKENFFVNKGDRVAQAVFAQYARAEFIEKASLDSTERGANGFGHTGK